MKAASTHQPDKAWRTAGLAELTPQDFESILQAIEDEVYITDGQGYTVFANQMCEKHYGVPVEQLLGKHVLELQEQKVYWPAVTPLVLQRRKPVTIEQNTMIGRKLVITGVPVFSPSGSIKMVVCTSRDVTELVRLKQQVEAQEQLLEKYAAEITARENPEGLVFSSRAMREVVQLARTAGQVETTVLILGESGVGKDLIAQAIHSFSGRQQQPLIKINCSAIPEPLLESELFGYAPGAFTGAKREGKPGLVAAAHRGTLFLDEIGDMPMALQAKMLQVIEEKRYLPIGANKYVTADVRILAATNQDLELLVRQGRFRQDLYYRLNVLTIWIPPLRERPEDILPLLHYYLHKSNEAFGLRRQLTAQTISCLLAYSWPGNVRELRNLMERLVLTARGETIDEEDLPASVRTSIGSARKESPEGVGLRQARDDFEREIIRATYERLKSSRKVARALGISQSTAIRKIRRYAAHGSSPQRALQPSSRKPEGVGTVS